MRRENRIKISFKYFESFETIYRVCVTWVARWCDVVFHTCLPFCINGLAWAILWLPLGAAFRLLSGCQRTKCNRNVLDYRTNLLCCSGISSSSPPRSFHSKCKTLTPHVGFTFFFWFIVGSWNCLAIVCTTDKSEQGIYVFTPATLLWATLRYCNGANTPVNRRFFHLYRGSRHGFMCHTATKPEQTIKKQNV